MGAEQAQPKKKRAAMKPVSESARGWAEALGREVEDWPAVTLKSAFGMTLVYRSSIVFAALPRTRALYEEDAILLKFLTEPPSLARRIAAEPHFAAGTMAQRGSTKKQPGKKPGEGHRWRIFLVREAADIHAAIKWLSEAYRLAGKKNESSR